ncbi:acyl-CoA dehydrogenase family protein, partial [Mycolicibacterium fortuitum]|uniref:acyl-CoA dehydrogenase family protein n=1 Tax=Mycolicibacterium fortuitum TaxID=1766 RepID=UPI002286B7E8
DGRTADGPRHATAWCRAGLLDTDAVACHGQRGPFGECAHPGLRVTVEMPDSIGVAQAMLDTTVSYAGVRQQFGRPIGSFQAVKHACADMLLTISVARQLVSASVRKPEPRAVSMAKSYATETAVAVAGKAMQLHGGIGYTWESGLHVYLKRAALNRSLYGSPAEHRARIAQRYR